MDTANSRLFYLQLKPAFLLFLRLLLIFLIRMIPLAGLYDNFLTPKRFFENFSAPRVETITLRSFFSIFLKIVGTLPKHAYKGKLLRRIQINNLETVTLLF